MTSAAMPPGRSRRSVPASTFTMVDSSPTSVGPPSTMSGILSPRSASTASAVVEVMRPEELALGAASGRPKRAMSPAPKPCGMRSAIVSRPAVTSGWMPAPPASGSTRVSGPGQKASASFSDSGSKTAISLAMTMPGDMGDQRIEARPAFRLEDAGDGFAIGRVAGEAVDRLGRDRDDLDRLRAAPMRAQSPRRSSGFPPLPLVRFLFGGCYSAPPVAATAARHRFVNR